LREHLDPTITAAATLMMSLSILVLIVADRLRRRVDHLWRMDCKKKQQSEIPQRTSSFAGRENRRHRIRVL